MNDRRTKLLGGIDLAQSVGIEIGPLAWPVVRKSEGDVIYVDWADAETLRANYLKEGKVPLHEIVDVDAIWGDKTLQEAIGAGRKVDYIIASHVIEHVPDLLGWLDELRTVLKPGGEIRLAIPDRRYTFDILRRTSTVPEVLTAHLVKARIPNPLQIIDFVLNFVDVNKEDAWSRRIDTRSLVSKNLPEEAFNVAMGSLAGRYRDVHCWVFTPRTFAELFVRLSELGLVGLECACFHDTERLEYEFFVALKPCDSRECITASWARMRDAVKDESREELLDNIELLNDRLSTSSTELEEMRQQFAAVLSSRSWRLTAPLRNVAQVLRRFI